MKLFMASFFMLVSISVFAQSGTSMTTRIDSPIKHDTVSVVIQRMYDTVKAKFYYEDGDNLKVYHKGFLVRQIQTNSAHPDQNSIISVSFYDEKMRPFTKPAFNPIAR